MKIKIEKINRREINTPNGREPTAWNIGILQDDVWYSAWAAPWNQDWKEGQVIDVEVKQNGKFWNIQAPGKAGQAPRQQQLSSDSKVLDEINNSVAQVMIEVLELKKMLETKKAEGEPEGKKLPF